ncbi:hypothetical protein BBJ28_00003552 [Nothophytophthora sp. Chile5]|nr:hypothetical protein BBJ28_00003552 [Nothophytophthora sp. Chile5]
MSDWLLAVHVGAGHYGATNEPAYLALMRSALEGGRDAIAQADPALTAAQVATRLLSCFERSPLTNAGLGSNLTEQRRVECEASVVCGKSRLVGACAAVQGVQEPSALAWKLLEQAAMVDEPSGAETSTAFAFGRQPPLVVVGDHARVLARDFGLETAKEASEELDMYQVTPQAERQWEKWHKRFLGHTIESAEEQEEDPERRLDTVGAICMDPMGNVAAALSSGGVAYKVPGRVGLAGCPRMGCNAANAIVKPSSRKRKRGAEKQTKNAFAVACTGRGEHLIRSNFVPELSRRLAKSTDLERAMRKTFADACGANGGVGIEGGVLALVGAPSLLSPRDENEEMQVRRVQLGAAFTTPCMGVGFLQCHAGAEAQMQLLRRPSRKDSKQQQLATYVSFLNLNREAAVTTVRS